MFELKQQSRNCRHVGNPTCRQMSCRLDTLADTTFSCVCDMTETCRRHVANTTQNVAVWAKKRHADIRHMELSEGGDDTEAYGRVVNTRGNGGKIASGTSSSTKASNGADVVSSTTDPSGRRIDRVRSRR